MRYVHTMYITRLIFACVLLLALSMTLLAEEGNPCQAVVLLNTDPPPTWVLDCKRNLCTKRCNRIVVNIPPGTLNGTTCDCPEHSGDYCNVIWPHDGSAPTLCYRPECPLPDQYECDLWLLLDENWHIVGYFCKCSQSP